MTDQILSVLDRPLRATEVCRRLGSTMLDIQFALWGMVDAGHIVRHIIRPSETCVRWFYGRPGSAPPSPDDVGELPEGPEVGPHAEWAYRIGWRDGSIGRAKRNIRSRHKKPLTRADIAIYQLGYDDGRLETNANLRVVGGQILYRFTGG